MFLAHLQHSIGFRRLGSIRWYRAVVAYAQIDCHSDPISCQSLRTFLHRCCCCYSHCQCRLAHSDWCMAVSIWYSIRNSYQDSRRLDQPCSQFVVRHDCRCAYAWVRLPHSSPDSPVDCRNVATSRSTNALDYCSNTNCSISTPTRLHLDRCTVFDCRWPQSEPSCRHSANAFVDFVALPLNSWHRHRRWCANFANEANSSDPTAIVCDVTSLLFVSRLAGHATNNYLNTQETTQFHLFIEDKFLFARKRRTIFVSLRTHEIYTQITITNCLCFLFTPGQSLSVSDDGTVYVCHLTNDRRGCEWVKRRRWFFLR